MFTSLTIFDRPALFLHPDFEIGKQNKEQRMVLFAKGPAIGEHKGQWEIPSLFGRKIAQRGDKRFNFGRLKGP